MPPPSKRARQRDSAELGDNDPSVSEPADDAATTKRLRTSTIDSYSSNEGEPTNDILQKIVDAYRNPSRSVSITVHGNMSPALPSGKFTLQVSPSEGTTGIYTRIRDHLAKHAKKKRV